MMTSRERVLTALSRKEPDKIPYIDWFESEIRREIVKAMGGA